MNLLDVLSHLGFKVSLSTAIFTVALLCARILPVIILSPFLGGEVTPPEVKIGVGVTLALVLFPSVAEQMADIPLAPLPFIFILIKEMFIGLCMSFVVSAVFEAAHIAGTIVDTLSGANMAQVHVPQLGIQVTLFSSLQLQLSIALFLTLDGHHRVIEAFTESLKLIPLNTVPKMSHGAWPFFDLVMHLFSDIFQVGLAISAPAFLATFLTDIAMGLVNKVAPQIQVYFLAMSIKPVVAVMMVMLVLHLIVNRIGMEFHHMLDRLEQALHLLA